MKNTIRGNQKTQPNKKNRIPSNKSLSTDKHTPACSKKMSLGLPCTKNDDVNRSMHQNFNSHICRDKNLCLIHKVPLSRHYIHCMLNCSSVTYILSNTVIIPCRHNQTKTGQSSQVRNQPGGSPKTCPNRFQLDLLATTQFDRVESTRKASKGTTNIKRP